MERIAVLPAWPDPRRLARRGLAYWLHGLRGQIPLRASQGQIPRRAMKHELFGRETDAAHVDAAVQRWARLAPRHLQAAFPSRRIGHAYSPRSAMSLSLQRRRKSGHSRVAAALIRAQSTHVARRLEIAQADTPPSSQTVVGAHEGILVRQTGLFEGDFFLAWTSLSLSAPPLSFPPRSL